MSDVITCPACDWEIDPGEQEDDLVGLLGAGVVGLDIQAAVEQHLNEHSTADWVRAMRVQQDEHDEVIEVLLDRIEDLREETEAAQAEAQRARADAATMARQVQQLQAQPAFAPPPPPMAPPPPGAAPFTQPERPLPPGVGYWPDGRMRVDPDQTLIPLIRGERPEGAVGRKI